MKKIYIFCLLFMLHFVGEVHAQDNAIDPSDSTQAPNSWCIELAGSSLITGITSWRLVRERSGLQLRVTMIPVLEVPAENSAIGPWFGFSIGKRF